MSGVEKSRKRPREEDIVQPGQRVVCTVVSAKEDVAPSEPGQVEGQPDGQAENVNPAAPVIMADRQKSSDPVKEKLVSWKETKRRTSVGAARGMFNAISSGVPMVSDTKDKKTSDAEDSSSSTSEEPAAKRRAVLPKVVIAGNEPHDVKMARERHARRAQELLERERAIEEREKAINRRHDGRPPLSFITDCRALTIVCFVLRTEVEREAYQAECVSLC